MRYTATLNGKEIGTGSLPEIRGPVTRAAASLFQEDPEACGAGFQDMNKAFDDSFMEYFTRKDGYWRTDIGGQELRITQEES